MCVAVAVVVFLDPRPTPTPVEPDPDPAALLEQFERDREHPERLHARFWQRARELDAKPIPPDAPRSAGEAAERAEAEDSNYLSWWPGLPPRVED